MVYFILMGILGLLGSIFRRRRSKAGPADAPGFLSSLLSGNAARAGGRALSASIEEASAESLGAELEREARTLMIKARSGELESAAQVFIGRAASARIADLFSSGQARGADAAADRLGLEIDAALALVRGLAESIGRASSAPGSEDGPADPSAAASYGLAIAAPEDLPYLRWSILDCRVFRYRIEGESLFIAIRRDAASRLEAALAPRDSGFAAAFLEPDPARADRDASSADAELAIDSPRSFPLGRVLAERRLRVPGGEARLRPSSLLLCATPRILSSRAQSGYRIGLAFSGPSGEESAILRILASPLGPYESGSQEWRALLGALAARSAASVGVLLGMEVRASSAGPASCEEALAGGPAVAVSYNVSFGGARGRVLIALDRAFLGLFSRKLLAGDPPERLELASRSPALAIEAIDGFLKARSFSSFMRSLREVPPRAQTVAARLPLGGRPLYAIMEELDGRDLAACIGKLVQKGFMLMEHRYAIFFHELPPEGSAAPAIVTPCEDYESLFSRFPERWDESDRARSRLRAAFGDLDGLIEAHYEAAWTLYRELLADRLPLSARGEAVLRSSGEAFAERLAAAIAEQSPAIEAAVAGAVSEGSAAAAPAAASAAAPAPGAESKRSLPWADKARELCLCPGALSSLLPLIGAKAADALRDSMARIESRLREGREDAYVLWKDRREFLAELSAGPGRAKRGGAR